MRYIASLFCGMALWTAVSAAEIAVPIHIQPKPQNIRYQVKGAGLYQDSDKIVWGISISNLNELLESQNFLVGIYSDSDNNVQTGRGASGWDFQVNVNCGKRTASVTHWVNNKPVGVPLYTDDYLVEFTGEMLYVAIRREPIKKITFADRPGCRIIGSAVGKTMGRIDSRINPAVTHGFFEPKLNFVRFGGDRALLRKKSEALLIERKDGFRVWNTFGERYEEKEGMPEIIGTAPALRISGAQGEHEAAFFAVTGQAPLTSLKVTPSPLQNTAGNVIGTASMTVRHIGFTGTLREEFFTDILSPVFMKSQSMHSFAMVKVNIPRNTPPGIYKGELALEINGHRAEPVPFEVEVFGFQMPERPFFKTAYCIKPQYLKNYFVNITAPEVMTEYAALEKLSKEYRFSPRLMLNPGTRILQQGDVITVDWSTFDKVQKKYFEEDCYTFFQDSRFQLGSHNRLAPHQKKIAGQDTIIGSAAYESWLSQVIKQTYEHYRELGILDKTAFIFWDEPYEEVFPQIKKAIEIAKKSAPGIECGVFIAHYEPQLAGHVDVWFSFFGTVAKLRSNPRTVKHRAWTYNDIGMSNFRLPASVPRLYYWLAMNYNIEGYLYSEINVYHDQQDNRRNDVYYNKWINHSWYYPGRKIGEPMPSLRMELSRDGLDDYDYLTLYRKYAKTSALPNYIRKVMPTMDREGTVNFPVQSNRELQHIRRQLAKEIEKLAGQ